MRKHKRVTGFSLHNIEQVAVYCPAIPSRKVIDLILDDFNKRRACLIEHYDSYSKKLPPGRVFFTKSKKIARVLQRKGYTVFEYERLGKNSFLLTS